MKLRISLEFLPTLSRMRFAKLGECGLESLIRMLKAIPIISPSSTRLDGFSFNLCRQLPRSFTQDRENPGLVLFASQRIHSR
jgi:hypothetical protein